MKRGIQGLAVFIAAVVAVSCTSHVEGWKDRPGKSAEGDVRPAAAT